MKRALVLAVAAAAVALVIGTIELLQFLATRFSLDTGFWAWLDGLDFGKIGYVVVGLFALTWAGSVLIWKTRRIEERWGDLVEERVR